MYSEPMVEGAVLQVVVGIVTGLSVAAGITIAKWWSQPRLEVRKIGDEGNALLISRGFRPILLGDAYSMEAQAHVLAVPNIAEEESRISRMVVNRWVGERIVRLNGINLGHSVTITYRPLLRKSGGWNRDKLGAEADSIGPFLFQSYKTSGKYRGWHERDVLVTG